MNYQLLLEKARGATVLDITDRLSRDGHIQLTQETERGHYERVVSDCTIDLSDMDGVVGEIFTGAKNTDRWYLRLVVDGGTIFLGPVRPMDVVRQSIGERIRITAMSMERAFWDAAATVKAGPHIGLGIPVAPTDFCTLTYLFTRDMRYQPWVINEGLFRNVDLGVYANRLIRDYNNALLNVGRWREINRETTWKDFLEQAALYYNAEYSIDVTAEAFVMRKRNATPSTFTNIDEMIVSDQEFEVQIVSQDVFDYLYTFAYQLGIEQMPQILDWVSGPQYGMSNLTCSFRMSAVINTVNGEVETMPGPATDPQTTPYQSGSDRWAFVVRIPATFASTVRRRLYMKDNFSGNNFKRIDTIEGNDQVDYIYGIDTRWYGENYPTGAPILVNAWHKFDEATGTWADPILDVDEPETPSGRIKDVRPMITFHEIGNPKNVLPYNSTAAFCLFAADMTTELVRQQYTDLFISRPLVSIKVEGIKWKVGDGIETTRVPGVIKTEGASTFRARVKKATIDVLDETAILGVVPI